MLQCGYFPLCPGCKLQGASVLPPPVYEDIKKYFNSSIPLFSEKLIGWRLRAKLAVRGTAEKPAIGLFKEGTHEIVEIPGCPLHHPSINTLRNAVENALITHHIEPYQEVSHKGLLRYLQFVVSRESGQVQLALILNANSLPEHLVHFLETLKQSSLLHSLWLNFQPDQDNRILGAHWQHYSGEAYLEETIAGTKSFFHPACFSQAHLSLFETMIQSIQSHILKNKKVVEFFAGVGAIGLAIADEAKALICSEINPYAKACFEKQLSYLPETLQRKISFYAGSSEALTSLLHDAEVVIVDPPRKGLSQSFRGALLQAPHVEQCIYVSCNFDSFKRDASHFLEAGWQIAHAEAYLLFPGTNQLETLTFFTR